MAKIYNRINLTFISIVVIMINFSSCQDVEEQKSNGSAIHHELIFAKGEKITNNNFTGNAYLQMLITADSLNQNTVGNVTFEPRARTKWHSHPAGQILLVTDGIGFYQEKGKDKKILKKGDAVKCPPDTEHWHGAGPDTFFVQLAITGREKGETVWLRNVTEEEYNQ